MMGLQETLSGLRREASGSYNGNYAHRGERGRGGTPQGAYGILDTNWAQWASSAGIPGADQRSRAAQDQVAAFVLQSYYSRYGSWEIAAAAWYGGVKSADRIVRNQGRIRNPDIAKFVKDVTKFSASTGARSIQTRVSTAVRASAGRESNGGWVFPVAGANEWSGGSFMDKHTKGDRSHHAIDIYASKGTPIVAPVSGTVTSAKSGGKLGGITVTLKGTDGRTYYFAHMSKHAGGIKKGMKVMSGHHLGFVGNTGSARGTKAHLHFSIKEGGKAVNPKGFLSGAETASGVYEAPPPDQQDPTSNQAIEALAAPAPFGSSSLEAMVQSAADMVAGGPRVDPRSWEDPTVEEDPVTGIRSTTQKLGDDDLKVTT